jgi:peroxiredoxin
MTAKGVLSFILPIAVFLTVAGVVYFAFSPRRAEPRAEQSVDQSKQKSADKIAGIEGLNEGETVKFPALTTVDGKPVFLDQTKEKTIICVFFSPSCAGCNKDVEFWRDLKEESNKREAAFYIIDVGSDTEALKNFISAYKIEALPILIDPRRRVGPDLKINFVPTYLLFAKDGKVLHRFDGVRNYDRTRGQGQVSEFFKYAD